MGCFDAGTEAETTHQISAIVDQQEDLLLRDWQTLQRISDGGARRQLQAHRVVLPGITAQRVEQPNLYLYHGLPRFRFIFTNRMVIESLAAPASYALIWVKSFAQAAEGYAHLWVMKPVMEILTGLAVNMKKYPNIRPGQDFAGYE